MQSSTVFGSGVFGRIVADAHVSAFDVGARGGFTADLLPIAGGVDAIGFEPDVAECRRLNAGARDPSPWRSLRYVPAAAAGSRGTRTLYLTEHRGASSLLKPLAAVAAERFSRGSYTAVESTVEVETMTLDDAVRTHDLRAPDYIKIDIEGAELEVFANAPETMAGVLAVRTEAAFLHTREAQPVFADVDSCLRGFGLVAMGFEELHHWRRTTRIKHPAAAPGELRYSKGQIAHGDMLYLRAPEDISDDDDGVRRLMTLALIALCYDYVDHAAVALRREPVERYLRQTYGVDVRTELTVASRWLQARYRRRRFAHGWRAARHAAAVALGRRA